LPFTILIGAEGLMIRLAIIGCGGMSQGWAEAAEALAERVRVTAAVDTDIERARDTAGRFAGARAEADFRKVLGDIDAALLVLPHHLHHPVSMECFEAGKHVLVEKPMANSEAECVEMMDFAGKRDLVLMVGYCLRYHPLFLRLKELLDSRTYGDLFQMSIWTEQLTKFDKDSWLASYGKLGGGQLFSHGCHYIDLLLWYMGEPVEGTHIGTNVGTPWMDDAEGTSNVAIRFASGAIGYHMGTWGAHGSRHDYAVHAHCTEGMLEARVFAGRLILHCPGAASRAEAINVDDPEINGPDRALIFQGGQGKYVQCELEHFLDCIETGSLPVTNAEDSIQGLRVIWRLYEAERKGTVADLRGLGLKNSR
jgi:predicted dehydrogenase